MKRAFDLVGSIVLLVVLSPLLVALALAVLLDSGTPVLYRQERVGRDGRRFQMLKFRSMVVGAENLGLGLAVARNDDRITRVGRWLRRMSLDELPQLFNVLSGEMSLVGPRPTIPSQVERYDEHQRRRLEVRPGMSGWAQVNGRNDLSWPERIELDIWYVDNKSLSLDTVILFRTVGVLFRRDGLYGRDGVTKDLEE